VPETRITQLPEAPTPEKCQVVVVEGPDMGRAAHIGHRLRVGSGSEARLKLTDPHVSAEHLEIERAQGGFVVKDLGSTNGTWFEGSRIQTAQVPVGATLKVGESYLRVVAQPEPMEVAPSASRRFGELVAESLAMREVFAVLELAARSDATLLVQGETGTGKELVARAVHEASARRDKPFVAVDCGALPEGVLESELFGHVKGAFTGAEKPREGAFLRAQGGTIFLDELSAVPLAVQARLLRVLEERKVRQLGSDAERALDVRVVAASGPNLEGRVAAGAFRPDLYYRLSVVAVSLPPLRQRREDIAPIVAELLKRRGFDPAGVSGENLARLTAHAWPGNVRELRNVVDRALALSPNARTFAELKLRVAAGADDALAVRTDLPFKEAKEAVHQAFERAYLKAMHEKHEGNVSAGAREAQVDRKHWRSRLKAHGLVEGDSED
jgi:transcriptional regulator with PAS, ATPase and Fis domain